MRHQASTEIHEKRLAEDWAKRGFSCDLWIDPRGQRREDFVLDTDEIVLVVEGKMEFEVEGQVQYPKAGQELLIPAGAYHFARNVSPSTARWFYGYRRS